ncbi:hypothetical protein OF001_U200040 [Pseudomonas sp. OF001]|nr:hypothetical protein OF001_U200040 [Pseudomonas sp. OF001]
MHAERHHDPAEEHRRRPARPARSGRRRLQHRRPSDGSRAAAGRLHHYRDPPFHSRPRQPCAPGGHRGGRCRQAGPGQGRVDQGRSHRHRCRHQPPGRWPPGRRRRLRGRRCPRQLDHPRAGRRGTDDPRLPAGEHPLRRGATARLSRAARAWRRDACLAPHIPEKKKPGQGRVFS